MAKDKTPKPRRPRAETPKGFRDYAGAEVRARAAMLARITEVYHAWGFDPLETSAVETVEALGKFLPDVDRPNEGVFAWQDEDESWLALRYDLTAPLARLLRPAPDEPADAVPALPDRAGLAQREAGAGAVPAVLPVRCGYGGVGVGGGGCRDVRDARRGAGGRRDCAGRLRGADQQPQGAERGDARSPALLDPADPEAHAGPRGIVMRAIDKLDRLGEAGVRALLGPGRRDESGDFTTGAGLGEAQAAVILDFLGARRGRWRGDLRAAARAGRGLGDRARRGAGAGDDGRAAAPRAARAG